MVLHNLLCEEKKHLRFFVQEMFDSHGTIYRKYGPYAQIQFKLSDRVLIGSIKNALIKLGFMPTKIMKINTDKGITSWKFYLSRQQELVRFYGIIQPKNKNHISRYNALLSDILSVKPRKPTDKEQLIISPSKSLAELTGIMFGDGKIYFDKKNGYRIIIWCNYYDEAEYAQYVKSLISKLFNRLPEIKAVPDNGVWEVRLVSKSVARFLLSLGIPLSHLGEMSIPKWILADDSYCKAFLRGLFDTDGCITFQRDRGYLYKLLKISMKSRTFAEQVSNALGAFGCHPYICRDNHAPSNKKYLGHQVVIRRKEDLNFWRSEIGTSNAKNLRKI